MNNIPSFVLKLKDVNFQYKNKKKVLVVLNKASLKLKKGEMVGLIAPSGAGKSTLLHISGLLERPTSGSIEILGVSCSTLRDNERTHIRKFNIGFIYQFHYLLSEFTALENIVIPQIIRGVDKRTAIDKALEILEKLNLSCRAQHRSTDLSGGEKQRVAIARAIINFPNILLADEPTGNLDPENSQDIFQLLLNLVQDFRITALIATHNHVLAKKMHRCITLNKGNIKEL